MKCFPTGSHAIGSRDLVEDQSQCEDLNSALPRFVYREPFKAYEPMPDGEIVNCFVGQCGTQMSFACWELFCLEHGIRPDGKMVLSNDTQVGADLPDPASSYFKETSEGQYVPRTVILDTEPTVVDEIRSGAYRQLFNPDSLITDLEDAASNFARGLYSCARRVLPSAMKYLRKEVERTDNLQAIFIYHSFGGGTGSGTTCKFLEEIGEEYTKTPKIEMAVYPGREMSSSVVEPYNAMLISDIADETSDVTILVDNEALVRIAADLLKVNYPRFSNINRLVAQVTSGMTAAVRFAGPLTASLGQLQTNLVPFPRLHYLQASMAPITSSEAYMHETVNMHELTTSLFSPETQLLTGDPNQTHVLACALLCRGDIAIQEIRHAVAKLKLRGTVQLVPWCPTGFKIGLCLQPPTTVPQSGLAPCSRSVVGLYNSTLLVPALQSVAHKVQYLHRKRAFVHWYVQEGLEEEELRGAHDGLKALIADFQHLETHGVPVDAANINQVSEQDKRA
ncbi:hypothetical protein CRM22_002247 [Opisthorchis felineus]|uniref:Tubulin alpha chain n=1 Tax=Opisthorchis felineus TaxID=147828 RepID=A0A4S2M7D9_OPIFE|nr:hypothetical protein CRM22_002247 [Opisthorchis felineus]